MTSCLTNDVGWACGWCDGSIGRIPSLSSFQSRCVEFRTTSSRFRDEKLTPSLGSRGSEVPGWWLYPGETRTSEAHAEVVVLHVSAFPQQKEYLEPSAPERMDLCEWNLFIGS